MTTKGMENEFDSSHSRRSMIALKKIRMKIYDELFDLCPQQSRDRHNSPDFILMPKGKI